MLLLYKNSGGFLMKRLISCLALCCLIAACTQQVHRPIIAGTQAADYSVLGKERFPNGQPAQKTVPPEELDVRSCDLSAWDFTNYTADELADVLTFDSKTKFPTKDKLPKGFSPAQILRKNQNPGLNIRKLHKQGITGKDVNIAIIDQSLLLDHEQYADRLQYYWQDPSHRPYADSSASMHGPAVTSILAGKTVGVATQANIYYWAGKFEKKGNVFNAAPIAEVLEQVLRYSFYLVDSEHSKPIRAVSISRGFDERDHGSAQFNKIVKELEDRGIAVFTTNDVYTLSRTHSLASPDGTDYCRPAYWTQKTDFASYAQFEDILIPTDFRVTAAPNGTTDYVHYAQGGLSWAVPYLAGLYALGVQVYPDLTKKVFMQAARDTADTKNCVYEGEKFTVRYFVNPTALINRLKELNNAK